MSNLSNISVLVVEYALCFPGKSGSVNEPSLLTMRAAWSWQSPFNISPCLSFSKSMCFPALRQKETNPCLPPDRNSVTCEMFHVCKMCASFSLAVLLQLICFQLEEKEHLFYFTNRLLLSEIQSFALMFFTRNIFLSSFTFLN